MSAVTDTSTRSAGLKQLFAACVVYASSSLLHFSHNAERLDAYPNMPVWITRADVYAVWLGLTAIGAAGVLLVWLRRPFVGLVLLAVYAAFGFDGLAHYTLAPMSAHTAMMNVTIWTEVVCAGVLRALVSRRFVRLLQSRDRLAG